MTGPSNDKFDSAIYRKSRWAYCFECMFEYFVALLVADAFLAKVLTTLGFTDSAVGVISSLIALAFLFQLLAVWAAGRIRHVKRTCILVHSVGQLFFMALYLVPLFPFAAQIRQPLAVFCILAAYFGNYFVTSLIYRWGNSFVHPAHRAGYCATKEMISLASGMVMSLAVGFFMDRFFAAGENEKAFLFAAIGILIFCLCDFLCLLNIAKEENEQKEKEPSPGMREVLAHCLGNRAFRRVILLSIMWEIGKYICYGFLGTYKIGELGYTVAQVQLINVLGAASRFALSRPFGKFSDRHSYARGFELGLLTMTVGFACLIFTTPDTRFLMLVFTVLYNVGLAGTSANSFNITYSYVDSRYFAQAMALKNSIAGLCGFLASLLGGRLLSLVQQNGNTVFSLPLYGQQLLAVFTVIIFVADLVFTHFAVCRQKTLAQ